MDPTLPQVPSFDFDRLDPIALEETLAYLRQHPEPLAEDIISCQALMADATMDMDWMARSWDDMQDCSGQSR